MRFLRSTRFAGVAASITAQAARLFSARAVAVAAALCVVLAGASLSATVAAAGSEPVDITFSAPGPLAGSTLIYHVTGTALGDGHSFAAGFDLGPGLVSPLDGYTDTLTSLSIGLADGSSGGDFPLTYHALPAPGDTVGLGLTYPNAAFYIDVADYTDLLAPPNLVAAGVFAHGDAFNNDTNYVLSTGCGGLAGPAVCTLADLTGQSSALLQFGSQETPEPASLALLAAGLAGLALAIRRRR